METFCASLLGEIHWYALDTTDHGRRNSICAWIDSEEIGFKYALTQRDTQWRSTICVGYSSHAKTFYQYTHTRTNEWTHTFIPINEYTIHIFHLTYTYKAQCFFFLWLFQRVLNECAYVTWVNAPIHSRAAEGLCDWIRHRQQKIFFFFFFPLLNNMEWKKNFFSLTWK